VTLDVVIKKAETRWPQLHFKRKTANEASAACPWCLGDDRFLVFSDNGYWCRRCGRKGWLDEEDDEWQELSPEERRLRLIEAEQRRARREREEQERRLSALERMHNCTDHLDYFHNSPHDKLEYWLDEGMTLDTIQRYQLGWCPRCPTDREGRPSFTIPVYDRDAKTLINIRHRLERSNGGDKYRPHVAGLGQQLFNSFFTTSRDDSIIITEGEKKSIILDQEGFPSVGIMGKRSFMRQWLKWLEPFRTVYVALDPDASESAERLAGLFGDRGRVLDLPVKADDFFVRYGVASNEFRGFIECARKIESNRDNL
jgi:hypothetical protein